MVKVVKQSLILAFLTVPHLFFSQSAHEIDVFIRYFDKKIYYLDKTEEIKIKITVANNSLIPFRFKVADSKVFNLDFEVKTPANISLNHADKFNIERNSFQYVFFKDIELKPDEEYGFIISLDRYIDLDKAGPLTVQAFFYPDLFTDNRGNPIQSNILSLNIEPPLMEPVEIGLLEEETGEVLTREFMPPDDVVKFTLNARQRSQWEKFFLYLDIEALLLNNSDWRIRYEKLSEEGRLELIEEYKTGLKTELVDQDILVIPDSFEIQTTSYTAFEGQVTVLEKFDYRDYTELKLYTYYVERKNTFWLITNYEVLNLGTE